MVQDQKLKKLLKRKERLLKRAQEKQKKEYLKLQKRSQKGLIKAEKRYHKVRQRYIHFLKSNNLWNDKLEAKYNPKKTHHDLKMDEFSEDFAIRYTRAKINNNKKLFNKDKRIYGREKRDNFHFHLELMNTVNEICKVNKWSTREDWVAHGLPMNKLMKSFALASKNYADILRYYSKKSFDKRKSLHMGR